MRRSVARPWSFVVIPFILLFLCPKVPGQTTTPLCNRPDGAPMPVEETTPAGTVLWSVYAYANMTWRIEFEPNLEVLDQYLEFKRDPSNNSFVLSLVKPIDVEEIDNLASSSGLVPMTLYCSEPGRPEQVSYAQLEVREVNEFAPEFNTSSIKLTVKENTAPGTPLLTLIDWASDRDVNYATSEIRDFSIAPIGADTQVLQMFYLSNSARGILSVREALDFDTLPTNRWTLQLTVRDTGGLTGTATLTITIQDEDDLSPAFYYSGCSDPCYVAYKALVGPNTTGVVDNIQPSAIQARDQDSLNYGIRYYLVQGPDNYENYLSLDPSTAQLTIVKQLHELGLEDLALVVEAREVSALGRTSQASLLISLSNTVVGGSQGVASASSDNSILIAAIILGVLFFIVVVCLIIGAVCFRKKYKTPVHPESRQPIRKDESPMAEDSPRSRSQRGMSIGSPIGYQHQLLGTEVKENGTIKSNELKDKKSLRGDDEVVTWMPLNTGNDIVDLSDEDTIRRKKKMNQAPNDTHLQTRGVGKVNKNAREGTSPQDFYSETEYAEVVTPPPSRKERDLSAGDPIASDSPNGLPVLLMNRMYGTSAPEPPARDKRAGQAGNTQQQQQQQQKQLQLGVEDTEYSTPRDTELATNANSHADTKAKSYQNQEDNQVEEINRSAKDQRELNAGYINKAFIKDEPQRKPPRRPGSRKPQKSKDSDTSKESIEKDSSATTANSGSQTSSTVDELESQSILNSDGSFSGSGPLYTTENDSPRDQPRRQWLRTTTAVNRGYNNNEEDEETEYSVPTSNRSSYAFRPLPVPESDDDSKETAVAMKQIHQDAPNTVPFSPIVGGNKPNLPPKPTLTPTQTEQAVNTSEKANILLESKKEKEQVDEPPYATIDKFKKSSVSRKAPPTADHNHDADQSGEAEDSSANESLSHKTDSTTTFALQPPSRRKRPRKRTKQPRAPEEDVYDGTKDYEDLEMDSGFYTDTSKTKIKRSSRLPVMKPDPNDTRYWITISNDY